MTRMGNTADSGSYNTGFRCVLALGLRPLVAPGPPVPVSEAAGKGGGGRKRPPDQKMLQQLAEDCLLQ